MPRERRAALEAAALAGAAPADRAAYEAATGPARRLLQVGLFSCADAQIGTDV